MHDGVQGRPSPRQIPIPLQFVPVAGGPIPDKSPCPAREVSSHESRRSDLDLGLVLAINGVEVRRCVVPVVQIDGYAVELTDTRHNGSLILLENCISSLITRGVRQCRFRPRLTMLL